ncbi:hypothetical protein EVAR_19857_1 [Eumeta japonica]|uniref:Uncharacterized protein n=1 Tax=Eumeta variegata TaxID=151549 RepID=A0A4C1US55_EUMVA|nr:hypothetical protein EVAR_19857_1 [Eumeta japonica]
MELEPVLTEPRLRDSMAECAFADKYACPPSVSNQLWAIAQCDGAGAGAARSATLRRCSAAVLQETTQCSPFVDDVPCRLSKEKENCSHLLPLKKFCSRPRLGK